MPNPHILLVDDEPDLLRALAIRLRAAGYRVTTAADGLGAVEAVLSAKPDLVVLDLVLPAADGHSVLQRLRGLDAGGMPPVVCLTANADADARRRAFAAGATGFVTKPFDGAELLATIAEQLDRARPAAAVRP